MKKIFLSPRQKHPLIITMRVAILPLYLLVALVLLSSSAIFAQEKSATVTVDWDKIIAVSKTTTTLQLVENPMVRPSSPIHAGTFKALKELGADYVRYVPWFPYPKMAVAELKPPDGNTTYWDFTMLDSTMEALMEATAGHSVVINFSTAPAWMWKTDEAVTYPDDPYQVSWNYNQGKTLRDTTAKELAAYYTRLFSWYTKGGFTDELGKFHKSGHFYKIPYWEVLNEPDLEHNISAEDYTRIYDEIVKALKKISPQTKFIGMSLAFATQPHYFEYFLNAKNHRYGIVPEGISYHFYATPTNDDQPLAGYQYTFFEKAEAFLDRVRFIENIRKRLAPQAFTTLNEIGSILISPRIIKPIDPQYWNLSGATYAWLFVELSKMGIDVVGESQLVGYPTQFPDVSMMNWQTGLPNARYWVLKLLHSNFSAGDKLVETVVKNGASSAVAVQGIITKQGKKLLLINKRNIDAMLILPGEAAGATAYTVDVSTGDNSPAATILGDTKLTLKPFSVTVVSLK